MCIHERNLQFVKVGKICAIVGDSVVFDMWYVYLLSMDVR